jgi:hypothetical protein
VRANFRLGDSILASAAVEPFRRCFARAKIDFVGWSASYFPSRATTASPDGFLKYVGIICLWSGACAGSAMTLRST